jgi:hypothetical protein
MVKAAASVAAVSRSFIKTADELSSDEEGHTARTAVVSGRRSASRKLEEMPIDTCLN